jgi:signal transduction histidine kinase
MRTLSFFAVLLLLSVLLCLSNQVFLGSAVPTVLYVLAVCGMAVFFAAGEKKKRVRLIERLNALFGGGEADLAAENEESALARQVVLTRKAAEVRGARLDEGYRNLSSLVSDIAHQSKTPLTSVRMYAEMLGDVPEATVIREQTDKLGFLFDALVKLSRCECGLIDENLNPAVCPAEALVSRAVSDVLPAADKKNVSIRASLPDGLTAFCDLRWTAEALFNLLDNAVKYSPPGSRVTVSAEPTETFVRIDVQDEGPGIPEEEINEIWKRFTRGKIAADKAGKADGVGIGLYLTRAVVTAQGGGTFCRNAETGGAVFSVMLPRRGEDSPPFPETP